MVTVGRNGFRYGFLETQSQQFGSLSGDTSFTIGSRTYTIEGAYVETGGSDDEHLTLNLDNLLAGADSAFLQLHVCDQTFSLNAAEESRGGDTYEFSSSGLDWSNETSRTLRLSVTDPTLSALSLSSGTLSPAFTSAHTSYTALVGNAVSRITVTPTTNDASATVTYFNASDTALTDAGTSSTDTFEVDLSVGANVIKVKVTAADTTTTKTYSVTVGRANTCNAPTLTGRTVIATTTVTVAQSDMSHGFLANLSGVTPFGSLSGDTSFTIGSRTYTIEGAYVNTGGRDDEILTLNLDEHLAGADRARLQLHVCDQTFSLNATLQQLGSDRYFFHNTGLDWSNETSRTLRLSVPTAPLPTALVSNFHQFGDQSNHTGNPRAMRFTTGSASGGYTLSSIAIISEDAEGDSFSATLCPADTNGFPPAAPNDIASHSTCVALTAPTSFAAGILTFTAPANTNLAANTTYSVVFLKGTGVTNVGYDATESTSEDGSPAAWSIGDRYEFYHSSGQWRISSTTRAFRIAVRGALRTLSTDATLSALALSEGTLSPTFSSAHTSYTASVGNAVSRITVTPTTNDAGATDFGGNSIAKPTVAYFDASDNALTDADTASTDTFEVDLSVGANVIKVKVTAANGTATKTRRRGRPGRRRRPTPRRSSPTTPRRAASRRRWATRWRRRAMWVRR